MENVTEILEAISDFSEFVSARALELVRAKGYENKLCLNKIEYEVTSVCVIFKEDTHHDCPDYEYADLSVNQLEMNDLEWRDHVNEVKIQTLTKKADEYKEREYLKLKLKQELIETK